MTIALIIVGLFVISFLWAIIALYREQKKRVHKVTKHHHETVLFKK